MPITTKIWKLNGNQAEELSDKGFKLELELEEILFKNFGMLSNDWMLIGRQVYTAYGHFIDLLAIDRNGDLIVLELKKDRTPREVIAQVLDYGSWIQKIDDVKIAEIFVEFQEKYLESRQAESFDKKFEEHFGTKRPDSLNSNHQLVVVAGSMDESSERIVDYLADHHEVNINFVLLRSFEDSQNKYITKTWHTDPSEFIDATAISKNSKWNGHYYVSFEEGASRTWDDAVKYGFISSGNGKWYSQTLSMLKPGDKIWVNAPKIGYIGTGIVQGNVLPANEMIVQHNGTKKRLSEVPLAAKNMFHDEGDPLLREYVVPVKWDVVLPLENAVSEVGLFGNQNTVCRPVTPKWEHTVKRLQSLLKVSKKAA